MTQGFDPGDLLGAGDTSGGDEPNRVIAGVLDSLRQARVLLLDPCPRNLDTCRVAVAQCLRKVGKLVEADRTGWNEGELANSLLLIRHELSAIADLLDSAAAFRRDMLKVISAASQNDAARTRVVEIDAAPPKASRVHVLG